MRLTTQEYDTYTDELVPGYSAGQGGALLIYVVSLILWVLSEFHQFQKRSLEVREDTSKDVEDGGERKELLETPTPPTHKKRSRSLMADVSNCGFVKCMLLNKEALLAARGTLKAMCEFGTILLWFYVADRTRITGESTKSYSRDMFLFVFLLLTGAGAAYTMKKARAPTVLNRNQTEEWKGWMQVLFLMYHYFEAVEYYNAIRVFIAAYVWMTGFGNFMYYYKTSDFGVGRFAQMMWRLNFLVIFCCVVLRNDYMLYYICPMHTLFTLFVFGALAIAPGVNKIHWMMATKIALCIVLVIIVWEVPGVFHMLWRPFMPLVQYIDPRKGEQDPLHEWFFRSGLDRYVWIFGMLCGWAQPHVAKWADALEKNPNKIRTVCIQAAFAIGAVVVLHSWYTNVYTLPKYDYNALHPFTSWIPISAWIVLRNLTEGMRNWSIGIFQWCGCITLETYISQFHTWLSSSIPNGQPKFLLDLVQGYPFVNFALVSALYVYISKRLFTLTNVLKDSFIPHDDNRQLAFNLGMMCCIGAAVYVVSLLTMSSQGLLA